MALVTDLATGDVITETWVDSVSNKTTQHITKASITAASSTFTAVADITGLSVTFTAETGRTYRISAEMNAQSTIAGDQVGIFITDSSNNVVQARYTGSVAASLQVGVSLTAFVSPGAGSVTYKIRGQRISGTGNGTVQASGTAPAYIWVDDLGT